MNSKSAAETLGFQGISEQLKLSIAQLTDSSKRLQDAIIKRNVENVWQILEEQQTQMQNFDRYNYLWKQLVIDSGLDTPQIRMAKQEIRSDIENLKRIGTGNAHLIRSFLSAIGRAFKRASDQIVRKVKVYDKKGKVNSPSSLLINRLG